MERNEQNSAALKRAIGDRVKVGRKDCTESAALIRAGYLAENHGRNFYVYAGSRYMVIIFYTTYRRRDAENQINNIGRFFWEVTPALDVFKHNI